jgi:hypothetical protein
MQTLDCRFRNGTSLLATSGSCCTVTKLEPNEFGGGVDPCPGSGWGRFRSALDLPICSSAAIATEYRLRVEGSCTLAKQTRLR